MANHSYLEAIKAQQAHITKSLIEYANNIILEFNTGDDPNLNSHLPKLINKARKKYKRLCKAHNQYYDYDVDVSEYLIHFCIPFTDMPDRMFKLMENINWLQYDSKEPISNKVMFYCSKWNDNVTERKTMCEWYIDIDGYIELLFIDNQLQSFYKVA